MRDFDTYWDVVSVGKTSETKSFNSLYIVEAHLTTSTNIVNLSPNPEGNEVSREMIQ